MRQTQTKDSRPHVRRSGPTSVRCTVKRVTRRSGYALARLTRISMPPRTSGLPSSPVRSVKPLTGFTNAMDTARAVLWRGVPMPDFLLTPDDEEATDAQGRLFELAGLHPEADIPATKRKGRELPPCYVPCEGCGGMVLQGTTDVGTRLALDPKTPTYAVLWLPDTPWPRLTQSRSYPVHHCRQLEVSA